MGLDLIYSYYSSIVGLHVHSLTVSISQKTSMSSRSSFSRASSFRSSVVSTAEPNSETKQKLCYRWHISRSSLCRFSSFIFNFSFSFTGCCHQNNNVGLSPLVLFVVTLLKRQAGFAEVIIHRTVSMHRPVLYILPSPRTYVQAYVRCITVITNRNRYRDRSVGNKKFVGTRLHTKQLIYVDHYEAKQ